MDSDSEYQSMSNNAGRAGAAAAQRDPFYVVKEKVQGVTASLRGDFESWKDLLSTANTATSNEFRTVSKSIKAKVKRLRVDVADLKQTIAMVEARRANFPDIDDAELASRQVFVNATQAFIDDIVETFGSDRTRRKLEADKKSLEAEETKSSSSASSSAYSGRGDSGGGLGRGRRQDEEEYVRGREQSSVMMQQKQNVVLDDMLTALSRLGDVAGDIDMALDEHNDMLDEFGDEMADTESQMDIAMAKVTKLLGTKDRWKLCCMFWLFLLMLLLFFLVIYS